MRKNPDSDTEESFVSRWSRRKTKTAEADNPEQIIDTLGESESAGEVVPMDDSAESPREREKKALTDEDMPDIDSLDENSDYSGFMSEGVSEAVRKLALRKLFAGAGFNIRDGLDDYDDDFRNFAALGDIITCDMKHQTEMREKRKREEEEEKARQLAESTEDEGVDDSLADDPLDEKSTEETVMDDEEIEDETTS